MATLLEAYRPYLLAIANGTLHRGLQRKVAPSDLVQETICRALAGFPQFNGTQDNQLRMWLRSILKNQVVDVQRTYQGTEKRNLLREVSLEEIDERDAVCSDPSPAQVFLQAERIGQLRSRIAALPGTERQVVILYHEQKLTFSEIGLRLNCSRETSRRIWFRALRTLSEAFGDDPCRNPRMT